MLRVGQRLKEERVRKGLTLEDVAQATKIRSSFLIAIEKGEFQKLPSSSYAQGFVRNYAEFLELSKREMSALFRREFDENKYFKVLPDSLIKQADFPLQSIKFSSKVFIIFLIFAVLLSYIFFQYRFAILNPPLDISFPKENSIINSQTIEIRGKTDSNANLYVDNLSVSLDDNGNFKKSIDLFPGKSTIIIKAVNKFGKVTEIERHVEVKE